MKHTVSVLFMIVCFSGFSQGKLVIEPESPKPGDVITYFYEPEEKSIYVETILQLKERTGLLNRSIDIPADLDGTKWSGQFQIPSNCVGFNLLFKNDKGEYDNNEGNGYYTMILDEFNNPVPGALAAKSTLYFGDRIHNIDPQFQKVIELLDRELSINPDMIPYFLSSYQHAASGLIKLPGRKDSTAIIKLIFWLDSINNARDRVTEEWILRDVAFQYSWISDRDKKEELFDYIINRFPEGHISLERKGQSWVRPLHYASSLDEGLLYYDSMVRFHENWMRKLNFHTTINNESKEQEPSREELRALTFFVQYQAGKGIALSKLMYHYINKGKLDEWKSQIQTIETIRGKAIIVEQFKNYTLRNDTLMRESLGQISFLEKELAMRLGAERSVHERFFFRMNDKEIEEDRLRQLLDAKLWKTDVLMALGKKIDAYKELQDMISLSSLKFERYNIEIINRLRELGFEKDAEELKLEIEIRKLQTIQYKEKTAVINGQVYSFDSLKFKNQAVTRNTGMKAPNFKLENGAGNTISLKDLKGKVVVIDFWATWCRPCLEVFPTFGELAQEYPENKVVFLLINVDLENSYSEKVTKKFVYDEGLDLNLIFDDANLSTKKNYGVLALPTCIVIDTNGVIRYRKVGLQNISDFKTQLRNWITSLSDSGTY